MGATAAAVDAVVALSTGCFYRKGISRFFTKLSKHILKIYSLNLCIANLTFICVNAWVWVTLEDLFFLFEYIFIRQEKNCLLYSWNYGRFSRFFGWNGIWIPN